MTMDEYNILNVVMHDMLDEYERMLIDDVESATIVAMSMYKVLKKTNPTMAKRFIKLVGIVDKSYR